MPLIFFDRTDQCKQSQLSLKKQSFYRFLAWCLVSQGIRNKAFWVFKYTHAYQDITPRWFFSWQSLKTQVHPLLRMCPGICSKETSAGSEVITQTEPARLKKKNKIKGGKTTHTFLLCKRKFVLRCTNARHDFSIHMGAPAKLHHQQSMRFRTRSIFGTGSAA